MRGVDALAWQRKHLGSSSRMRDHPDAHWRVIGKTVGFEAFVTLDKTKPPENRLLMHDNVLTIDSSNGVRGQMPFDVEMHPPTEARPFSLALENSNLKLVIDHTTENLVPDDTLAGSSGPDAPPGWPCASPTQAWGKMWRLT